MPYFFLVYLQFIRSDVNEKKFHIKGNRYFDIWFCLLYIKYFCSYFIILYPNTYYYHVYSITRIFRAAFSKLHTKLWIFAKEKRNEQRETSHVLCYIVVYVRVDSFIHFFLSFLNFLNHFIFNNAILQHFFKFFVTYHNLPFHVHSRFIYL